MPKERMIELSEQQIARMVTVSQAVAADVLTDGEHHFMLLGAFACRLRPNTDIHAITSDIHGTLLDKG